MILESNFPKIQLKLIGLSPYPTILRKQMYYIYKIDRTTFVKTKPNLILAEIFFIVSQFSMLNNNKAVIEKHFRLMSSLKCQQD